MTSARTRFLVGATRSRSRAQRSSSSTRIFFISNRIYSSTTLDKRPAASAETELVEAFVERSATDSEEPRRLGAVVARALQRLEDGLALGLAPLRREARAGHGGILRRRRRGCGRLHTGHLARDVELADDFAIGEHDEPLDDIGELADVARPIVLGETGERSVREAKSGSTVVAGER